MENSEVEGYELEEGQLMNRGNSQGTITKIADSPWATIGLL
jgi:hypothetical protein